MKRHALRSEWPFIIIIIIRGSLPSVILVVSVHVCFFALSRFLACCFLLADAQGNLTAILPGVVKQLVIELQICTACRYNIDRNMCFFMVGRFLMVGTSTVPE